MPFIEKGGVRLHWDQRGSGVPILLIMGHRYSSAMWYPVFEALGDRYHLIHFDNQGTGQSGARADTTVEEMTSDAVAVLDAAGVETAHIYGVSMGGGIALEFGLRYPERTRSLILGCTMGKWPEFYGKRTWVHWLIYHLPSPILKLLASKKYNRGYGDAAPEDKIQRDMAMLARDPFSRKGVWAQAKAISDYSADEAAARALQIPALVLHGTQDLAVPYEQGVRLVNTLPNARMVTYPEAGHNYFIAYGEQANAEVDAFIQKVEADRAGA